MVKFSQSVLFSASLFLDIFPLWTLGSSGFTAEKNEIIAVVTSTRFKIGQMISRKPFTISYNGFSHSPVTQDDA